MTYHSNNVRNITSGSFHRALRLNHADNILVRDTDFGYAINDGNDGGDTAMGSNKLIMLLSKALAHESVRVDGGFKSYDGFVGSNGVLDLFRDPEEIIQLGCRSGAELASAVLNATETRCLTRGEASRETGLTFERGAMLPCEGGQAMGLHDASCGFGEGSDSVKIIPIGNECVLPLIRAANYEFVQVRGVFDGVEGQGEVEISESAVANMQLEVAWG